MRGFRAVAAVAVAAAVFSSNAEAANELFGWVFSAGSSRLVTFNLVTGARTNVGGTVASCCFVSGGSTIDTSGGRFFFTGNYSTETPGTDPIRLFNISTATGAATTDAQSTGTGNIGVLEWSPSASKLYAIVFQTGSTSAQLNELNPTTGARTTIGSPIANCCSYSGAAALDATGARLFFVGQYSTSPSTPRLFTVNTATGALVVDPAPALVSTNNYNFLEWDPSPGPGTLYAVVRDTVGSDEDLVTINPTTGAVALVGGNLASCCGVSADVASLDPNANRFFFIGTVTGDAAPRLFSLNLATGAVVNNPLLSGSENYNYMKFAPSPLPVTLTTFGAE